jgi:phosphoglycolate phosphatase
MKNIRLVAFDLDGTLIDSRPDLAAAINKAISAYSFPPRKLEEFNQIVGNGHHTAIIRACPKGTDEAVIDRIQESYLTDYDEHCCVNTTVYPGITELTED